MLTECCNEPVEFESRFCPKCGWEFRAREELAMDAIKKHLPMLKDMASQILCPKDNTISRMVRDFEKALGLDL